MTTLHSITHAREAAAAAAQPISWPSDTQHTPDDVIVHGISLATTARRTALPLVRIGADESGRHFISVVVARVEHVDHFGPLRRADVWVDAVIGQCSPILEAARLIGRPVAERRRRVRLVTERDPDHHLDLSLPSDVVAGDLLAVPCVGTVARAAITHRSQLRTSRPPAVASRVGAEPDELERYGRCGK